MPKVSYINAIKYIGTHDIGHLSHFGGPAPNNEGKAYYSHSEAESGQWQSPNYDTSAFSRQLTVTSEAASFALCYCLGHPNVNCHPQIRSR